MNTEITQKVVVTQGFFDGASVEYLRRNGIEVSIVDLPGGVEKDSVHEDLVRWLDGASGWIVGHARVTRRLLEALPDLRVIARRGVGYERVDLDAVRDLGRVATIAAGGNAETVADQAVGMMLALGRRFREGQTTVEQGRWDIPVGTDLYAKSVGIVGLGRIGQAVLKRLQAFDARVLVNTRRVPTEMPGLERTSFVDLGTLLAEVDYVTLHAPLNESTRFLVRDETLRLVKPTAFVINTARGGLVEDRDLLDALKEGRLAGAGLDVFMSESDRSYEKVTRELAEMPNVIVQPHAGASTGEALARTNMLAARAVVGVLHDVAIPPGCVVADGRGAPDSGAEP